MNTKPSEGKANNQTGADPRPTDTLQERWMTCKVHLRKSKRTTISKYAHLTGNASSGEAQRHELQYDCYSMTVSYSMTESYSMTVTISIKPYDLITFHNLRTF